MALGVLVVLAALSVCCSSGDKKNGIHDSESKQSEVKLNMTFSQPNAPPSEENMV
ncbi:hypothetical protein AB205_0130400 [Aquarana catesbeiana]|uniref:Uncharacterized protein n=1 Tax=Aquarana catesbeiana TaxID=8400 RepID=A0A2G9SAN9_AQUCT|nr:hypothetical protein AB205_0130400 [Aquarana catesbeiana]